RLTHSLALGPPADLAERLRQAHSRRARQVLRANAAGQPRLDVATYCVSALQAACLLFVGVRLLLPVQDSGFAFGREHALARKLVGNEA
ncbi:MAG: hypothetical protein ACKO8I_18960, partial [Cyanobacteriota bacterium]